MNEVCIEPVADRHPRQSLRLDPGPSVRGRLGRNIAASYLGWAVGMLSPLILVPLLVRLLGHELYGQWVVVLSLTSYLGLANLGIGQTVGNRVAEAAATDQEARVGAIISTAFFCYAGVAAALLAGCALAWASGLAHMLPRLRSGKIALGVMIALTALSLPLNTHRMVLRGLQRVDLEQRVAVGTNLARTAALALVLLLGLKLVSVAVVHGLAVAGSGAFAYIIARALRPDARPRISWFSLALLKEMLKPSAAFFGLQVAGTVVFGIDNLVIMYALGAKWVTQYSVPFQIVMMTAGVFGVALGALMPSVTTHHALGEKNVLATGYLLFVRLAVLYGGSAALFLWFAGRALLRLWVGGGVFPGYATFAWQLAFLFIQVLLIPADAVLMATSRHYAYAALAAVEAILNLALSLWWVRVWGLAGVIRATVVARLLTNGWYMPLAAMRASGFRGREFLFGAGRTLLVSVTGMGVFALVFSPWDTHSTAGAIALACGCTAAFWAVALGLGLTRGEHLWAARGIWSLLDALVGGRRAADRAG